MILGNKTWEWTTGWVGVGVGKDGGAQVDGTEGQGSPSAWIHHIPRLHELTLGACWGESPGICSM